MPDGKALRCTGSAPAVEAEVRPSRGDVLTPVGDQLRAERERRRVTLSEVVKATKIRRSYLEALERHDWDALPASVFARGYLRSYAEHLGMDSEHLLRTYDRQRRLDRADDPSAADREESETRALLEQIARARGIDTRSRRPWEIGKGIALAGTAVAAVVAWVLLAVPAAGPADGHGAATETSPPAAPPIVDAATTGGVRTDPASAKAPDVPSVPKDTIGSKEPHRPSPARAGAEPAASTSGTLPAPAKADSPSVPVADTPVQGPAPSHLTVLAAGIESDLTDPTLDGAKRFEEGSVVWFRASVRGGRPGETIRHLWRHGSRPIAVAVVDLRGGTWPTESRMQLSPGSIGDWTVEARDPDGRLLADARFTCVPTEGAADR